MRKISASENEAAVPGSAAEDLRRFKDALAALTEQAFACSSSAALPEQLQKTLADASHANLVHTSSASTQDEPAYGSDLAVQVFQLFGTPKILEVDFRYSVPCGDDHLLLVYGTASDAATDGWHQRLRWDSQGYATVGDALGDFVLLTPLTLNHDKPSWHYLVAHGHPGCGELPRQSEFDLDLLTPGADPAHPTVTWHFAHAYQQGAVNPRLATTEDTIDFRLVPATPGEDQGGKHATPETAAAPEIFRFRLTPAGKVEPAPTQTADAGEGDTSGATAH